MTEEELQKLGGAVVSEVIRNLSIPKIRETAAAAGIDASRIPAGSEAQGGMGSRAEVAPALIRLFSELSSADKKRALPILAGRVFNQSDEARASISSLLKQYGYRYESGTLVREVALDDREARYLPETAMSEIARAMERLALGDESGAITAACGAIDATATHLYEKHQLGDSNASFQAKVNTVLNRLKVFDRLEHELTELRVKPQDAKKIRDELCEATRHATEALQVIRRANGDVHGAKPTYTKMAYDTIKWASAICGLLQGE